MAFIPEAVQFGGDGAGNWDGFSFDFLRLDSYSSVHVAWSRQMSWPEMVPSLAL